mmetsp:Transcript_59733/g.67945  ORF Transcript_59733/g.67945 Transcript_59733/m.67945 type:complete len:100 (-) Transcript_59733:555-854(-)
MADFSDDTFFQSSQTKFTNLSRPLNPIARIRSAYKQSMNNPEFIKDTGVKDFGKIIRGSSPVHVETLEKPNLKSESVEKGSIVELNELRSGSKNRPALC